METSTQASRAAQWRLLTILDNGRKTATALDLLDDQHAAEEDLLALWDAGYLAATRRTGSRGNVINLRQYLDKGEGPLDDVGVRLNRTGIRAACTQENRFRRSFGGPFEVPTLQQLRARGRVDLDLVNRLADCGQIFLVVQGQQVSKLTADQFVRLPARINVGLTRHGRDHLPAGELDSE